MRVLSRVVGWLLAGILVLLRLTCRYRVLHDPRPALRRAGRPYAYALPHAHQVAAVFVNDEPRMAAMVSRSADGDLLVPSLRVRRVLAARGSSRSSRGDKGGQTALAELTDLARRCIPVLLAVDGPRGPRGHVHRGVVQLACEAPATVLPTIVIPTRRWILRRTWDRFQIPKPFSTVRLIFAEPIEPDAYESDAAARNAIAEALAELEATYDPAEWAHVCARAAAEGAGRAGADQKPGSTGGSVRGSSEGSTQSNPSAQ